MKIVWSLISTWVPVILKATGAVVTFCVLIFGFGYGARQAMTSEIAQAKTEILAYHDKDIGVLHTRLDRIEQQNATMIKQQGDMLTIMMTVRMHQKRTN